MKERDRTDGSSAGAEGKWMTRARGWGVWTRRGLEGEQVGEDDRKCQYWKKGRRGEGGGGYEPRCICFPSLGKI